jgi:hypothetical protein
LAPPDVSLNEQVAIHYNCACCHARLDDAQAGLVSLVRSMEVGYDDFANIRSRACRILPATSRHPPRFRPAFLKLNGIV